MEIKAPKSRFTKAISLVGNVATQKANTLPILGNILFETVGMEHLRVTGTDLEVGICTTIPVEVKKEGSITIPAKKINEIARETSEDDLEISVAKNNAVNIRAGKAFFKIMGLGKEDFPKLPEWKEEDALEIDQGVLRESLVLTAFAISTDETRYVLNGILMTAKGKKLRVVATDGRRMAVIDREFENKKGKNFEIIVPTKAVHELIRMLTWEGEVKIISSKNQVIFHLGESYLSSRLIEGTFPNYEQVIPKEEKTKSSVGREELLQALRRTSLLTSPDSPAVKLDFVRGKLLISSKAPNLGEAKEEMTAETTGGELAIGFNPQYLIDVLKNLDIENVSLSLTDPDKPGLFTGKEGYQYVVMPMQLS